MKFLAQKSVLSPALAAAKLVVPAKPAIAIAGCFLLRLKDDNLEITANDLTGLGLCLNIKVEGEQNGEIAVSASDFADTVSNAPDGELSVAASGLNLTVSWGEERDSDLTGRSSEDFIKTPDIEPDNYVTLKVPALSFLLSKVAFAASKNSDNRPSLTGILLEAEESRMVSVGTDSHRLSRVYVQPEAEEPFSLSRSSIVPPRAIQALLQATNAVGDAEASILMGFSETHLKFQTPNATIVAKLLEGPYPAWRPVIPKNLPISIKFNTAEMLEILQRVNVAADKTTHNARLTVQDSTIRISAVGSRRTREKISCIYENPESSEPLHLGVNVSYLIEILKVCGSDETEILVNGEHSLCEILPAGGDSELLFLLMLVRLAE
ncbi:MAG: DNA polymerase III subunit beta [Fibromonadales bacterium]|nr:DNA polymerase III subunit beta [Fibromonadales bacterium]MCL2261098.1 DNA polymerase III subunit beta [Fibromonadales bacterium]